MTGVLTHRRGGNTCQQTSTVELGSKSSWHTNRQQATSGWDDGCDNMTSQADWHTLRVEIIVNKQVQLKWVSKSIWHTNRHEPKPRTNKQINSQRVQFECYWGWGAGCDNMTSQADWHTLGVEIIVNKQVQLKWVVSQSDILTDTSQSPEQTNK